MVPITRFKVVSITSARDLVIVIAPSVAIPFIAIVVVPSVVISVICLREGRSAAIVHPNDVLTLTPIDSLNATFVRNLLCDYGSATKRCSAFSILVLVT